MRLFGITKISIIPRHMWRAQIAETLAIIVQVIGSVLSFYLLYRLHLIIHPYIVSVVQRLMN